ncbi:MAG TPA: cupredoxin domain-containing protein [Egicoccus sp.]|nr:cupredoxin domain-containing protein [Egicoccus sp.]HSK24971.1 cupredoxin domain-containing protein [Egicoccus sp.]
MSLRRSQVLLSSVAVLALTACGGGGDDGGDADGAASGEASGSSLTVEAGDLYFDPETLSAPAGEIEITLNNTGVAQHDFVVEEAGDEMVVEAMGGETATGTIELEAGTYTFYCAIPGHRTSMEGTLQVG